MTFSWLAVDKSPFLRNLSIQRLWRATPDRSQSLILTYTIIILPFPSLISIPGNRSAHLYRDCWVSRFPALLINSENVDVQVVLSCALHKDLQYTRANPTFHHWRTEGKRFGLTFQSSTEARHFEKAIRRAVEGMREGLWQYCGRTNGAGTI